MSAVDVAAPNAVIVLGMHRSGTSAVAGALAALGVNLGDRLVAAQADNPKGYWEHADAVLLHERLLAALDTSWEDPRALPTAWRETDAAREASRAAATLIEQQFVGSTLWAVKDPRQCRLLPVWAEGLAAHGVRPAYLFVLRDPAEVAASLRARNGIGEEHAARLWLEHVLDADRDTPGNARACLDYARLLADPVAALSRLEAALGVSWPRPPTACRAALAAFVDTAMRHQSNPGAGTGPHARLAQAAYAHALDAERRGGWPDLASIRAELATLPAPSDAIAGLARAIARDRAAFATQERRLADTDRALDHASRLSIERMEHATRLGAALSEAQQLSLQRMAELQQVHAQLQATDRALEETKALSLQRLEEIQAQSSRAEAAEAAVQAMANSRSWRLTRPLRALSRWLAGVTGRRGDA